MHRRAPAAVAVAVLALVTTGCSDDSDPEVVTVTADTPSTGHAAAGGPSPTAGAPAPAAPAQAAPAAPAAPAVQADNPDQVGGTCGVLDGAKVTAGESTSCGFAMNVAAQALQPVYGPDTISSPDANGYAGVATVTATSPSTGQTYTMQCGIGSAASSSVCTGGNNAQVTVSKNGNGSLLYLVR
jgi:hypothetical protein